MASFIARGFELPATTQDLFPDDEGNTHEDNINRLAAAGITVGLEDGTYKFPTWSGHPGADGFLPGTGDGTQPDLGGNRFDDVAPHEEQHQRHRRSRTSPKAATRQAPSTAQHDPVRRDRWRRSSDGRSGFSRSSLHRAAPRPRTTTTPQSSDCTNGTTISEGDLETFGEYFVHNNNWNDNYGGDHTIVACAADNWYALVNVPNHDDNAVEAYMNVHKDYDDEPLANINSATFAAQGPHCDGCIWNIAFDIWLGDGLTHELMIWTENWGQRPPGRR